MSVHSCLYFALLLLLNFHICAVIVLSACVAAAAGCALPLQCIFAPLQLGRTFLVVVAFAAAACASFAVMWCCVSPLLAAD
jgi:hypothetical protein